MKSVAVQTLQQPLAVRQEQMRRLDLSKRDSPQQQALQALQQWLSLLERDKNSYIITYNKLIPQVKQFESWVQTTLPVQHIPPASEYHALIQLRKDVDEGKYNTPDLQQFITELDKLIAELKAKFGSSKLVQDIQRSTKLKHAVNYIKELQYLETILNNVKHDDASWTYFRQELYAKRQEFANQFAQRFGDPKYARWFIAFFAKYHADRNRLVDMLGKIIEHMKKPSSLQQVEKEGLAELDAILKSYIEHQRLLLEDLRLKAELAVRKRIQVIQKGTARKERQFREIVDEQNLIISALAAQRVQIGNVLLDISHHDQQVDSLRKESDQLHTTLQGVAYAQQRPSWKKIHANEQEAKKLLKEKQALLQSVRFLHGDLIRFEHDLTKNLKKKTPSFATGGQQIAA